MDNTVYMLGGKLYINLTNRCTNDCSFCIRLSGDGVAGTGLWLEHDAVASQVIESAEKIADKYSEAVFCGYGESTMCLDTMLEVARYFKLKGVKTRLNTNGLGSAFNGFNIAPKLVGLIDTVSVSLNEASAQAYDELCRPSIDNSFDELKKFTSQCVLEGLDTVMTVVDVIGADKVAHCRDIANSLGARFRVRKFVKNNYSDGKNNY